MTRAVIYPLTTTKNDLQSIMDKMKDGSFAKEFPDQHIALLYAVVDIYNVITVYEGLLKVINNQLSNPEKEKEFTEKMCRSYMEITEDIAEKYGESFNKISDKFADYIDGMTKVEAKNIRDILKV